MTTIAYKDGLLVGDSCESEEPEDESGLNAAWCFRLANKIHVTDHVAFGTSGDADCIDFVNMIKALRSPADFPSWKKRSKFADVRALICFRTGEVWVLADGELSEFSGKDHIAIGSGRKFAMGAMDFHASALESTRCAAMRCLHTRAPFHVFDVVKWKWVSHDA